MFSKLHPKEVINNPKLLTQNAIALIGLVFVAVVAAWALPKLALLSFTGNDSGDVNVYIYDGKKATKFTQAPENIENWSSALGVTGNVYFTSNRDGKVEIYRLVDGETERITNTPGKYESWSPASRDYWQCIFHQSDGKGRFIDWRMGKTVGSQTLLENESWSPALGVSGGVYFTSNRDGKMEIYRLVNGKTERVTNTPGNLRVGLLHLDYWQCVFHIQSRWKAEFTCWLKGKLNVLRIHLVLSKCRFEKGNLYFTSNRSGRNQVFILMPEVVVISDIVSWTKKLNDKFPEYR
ncbi:MAG: PD40 domain-containing protein [Anaerolineales bacterium]|nr:PD40 domain-containing protein [Anaerolineales bacterium]